MSYPYDPQTRELVAQLLYQALPSMYRAHDEAPEGRGELKQLLEILAVPLAAVRQSIEELHADLFIDTANDWVLPYLAEMVGTVLIFEDADRNRRDVRETVGWRRRKGTPPMLQELASLLAEQTVVTHEGWKLVQMTQDLDLVRPSRVLPELTDPRIAEKASGPLTDTAHLVDVRAIGKRTGKFHPLHVFHWAHPTRLFELDGGTPADLTDPVTDPDLRFAFHPAGEQLALRARRVDEADELQTDLVPPMHFAADPGSWFGREGRFSVSICGVEAGIAEPVVSPRVPSTRPASVALLDGSCRIEVLEHEARRFYGTLRVEVVAAPFAGPPPGLPDTTPANIDVRARVDVDALAPQPSVVVNNAPADPGAVVMIRILPIGAGALLFPGATLEISSSVPHALLEAEDPALAVDGFLRGALVVTLPETHVDAERWFYIAADGSLVDAQSTGANPVDVQILDQGGNRALDPGMIRSIGIGPAWPPLPPSRDSRAWSILPQAPGRGPAVLHGGGVLRDLGGGAYTPIPNPTECSLVFALGFRTGGGPDYRPFVRLAWQGPDPAGATWIPMDDNGQALPAADARLADLADFRDTNPTDLRLAVRFECGAVDGVLAPAEVAWPGFDGRTVLVHLPQLAAQAANPIASWPTDLGTYLGISDAVYVGIDGSTWVEGTGDTARVSQGAVAPIREARSLRRRRVHHRSLCQWNNENPPAVMHQATAPGRLDIDVGHGLFSLAGSEPPQASPVGPDGPPPPPALTVRFQQGSTWRTGALPMPRETFLDRRLPMPTRIVTRSGHLHRNAAAPVHDLPRYRTLGDALLDIAAAPLSREVIQIEDSATYPGESIAWPAGVDRLTIQAAEDERPWIEIANWAVGAADYEELTLTGIALGASALGALDLPPAGSVLLQLLTVTHNHNTLVVAAHPSSVHAAVEGSVTGGLQIDGDGVLAIRDSVVDRGLGRGLAALVAAEATVTTDRVTVFGTVGVRVLEASETYFDDDVTVEDRFEGCVRYSRVTSGSVLPRIHRVVHDLEAHFVSVSRHHPAHARMAETTDPRLLGGAENGGEIGAFHLASLAKIYRAVLRRLVESTPAGLSTGLLRSD